MINRVFLPCFGLLTGYVRVTNSSGELYDNAQTRLVVGKINLVEKIAALATKPPPPVARRGRGVGGGAGGGRGGRGGGGGGFGGAMAQQVDEYDMRAINGTLDAGGLVVEQQKDVAKEGLSEYFLFTIEGREDIKDREPKRLVALKAGEVPLESIYKLTDRTGDQGFTKFYRFKNIKLLDDQGKEKKLPSMENLGLSPLPNGMVKLYSEYKNKDLAYVGGTATKYVPIGDRVEVNVGPDKDITIRRNLKDQKVAVSNLNRNRQEDFPRRKPQRES